MHVDGLSHFPCLAIDGVVISMSMPTPGEVPKGFAAQSGQKPGSMGKLLPGWYLEAHDGGEFTAHGPAAPEGGIKLPGGLSPDAESFLVEA